MWFISMKLIRVNHTDVAGCMMIHTVVLCSNNTDAIWCLTIVKYEKKKKTLRFITVVNIGQS